MAVESSMSDSLVYNPFSYDMHEDPYPTYARLREEAPAYHNEEMGFCSAVVTRSEYSAILFDCWPWESRYGTPTNST